MKTLGYSLLVAAVLSGCTDAQFASLNQNFAQAKNAAATTANANLPAAAIATNVAVVSLMGAIGKDAAGQKGGVIAVGSGHYALAAATDYSLDPATKTGKLKSTGPDGKALLDATFAYDTSSTGSGTSYSISDFKGKVLGFGIDLAGKFDSNTSPASVKAEITGSLTSGSTTFSLETLSFAAAHPMPADVSDLGKLVMTADGNRLELAVSMKGGQAAASGELKNAAGVVIQRVTASEAGGVKFENVAGTDADS